MQKKKSLIFAVSLALAFGLTACSKSDSTEVASASCEKADLATVTDG